MQVAGKISITLSPDILRSVNESIEAGEYASTSDVLHDAVRLWQRQRLEVAGRVSAVKARIRRSLDDPRADLTGDEVDAHLNGLFAKARGGAIGAQASCCLSSRSTG